MTRLEVPLPDVLDEAEPLPDESEPEPEVASYVRRKPGRPAGSKGRPHFGTWTHLSKKKQAHVVGDITPAWALDRSLLPKRPPGKR